MKTKTSNRKYNSVTSFVTLAVYAIFFLAVTDVFAQGRIYKVTQYHGLAANLITGQYRIDANSSSTVPTVKAIPTPIASRTAVRSIIDTNTIANKVMRSNDEKNGELAVNIPTIRANGKVLFQESEHSYKYLDGKKVGGDAKLVAYLSKGKPITEATYYFELKKAGYIKGISLWNFGKLSIAQKQRLIAGDIAYNN